MTTVAACRTCGTEPLKDATVAARSIIDDLDGVAEPVTPLGKQHHTWVRRRGLPCGLEAHDHP